MLEERILDMWGVKPTSMMDKNKFHCVRSSRKYPDPNHEGNWKFWRGEGVSGPGNSEGGRPSSLPDVQEMIFCEFILALKVSLSSFCGSF